MSYFTDFFPHVHAMDHADASDPYRVLEITGHPWLPKWLIRYEAKDWWSPTKAFRCISLERPGVAGRGPRTWVATYEVINQ